MFQWCKGMDALRARRDPAFGVGERIDAEVVEQRRLRRPRPRPPVCSGSPGRPDFADRVRRCIAVGLASTSQDFRGPPGRVTARQAVRKGSWCRLAVHAGQRRTSGTLGAPPPPARARIVACILAMWAVTFRMLIVGWFWAEVPRPLSASVHPGLGHAPRPCSSPSPCPSRSWMAT